MRVFFSYLRLQLKSNLRPIIILSALSLLLGGILCAHTITTEHIGVSPGITLSRMDFSYEFCLLSGLCVILPVWLFAPLKKKHNIDCYYSLPIKWVVLDTANYIFGLLFAFALFAACFIQKVIIYAFNGCWEYINGTALTHVFLLCLLYGWIVYSSCVFAFNEANTVFDGCIFIVISSITVYFFASLAVNMSSHIYYAVLNCTGIDNEDILFKLYESDNGKIWEYFQSLLDSYSWRICREDLNIEYIWGKSAQFGWLLFWAAIGIVATLLAFVRFGRNRQEKAGGISDTPFGYKTVIPVFSAAGLLLEAKLFRSKSFTYFDIVKQSYVTEYEYYYSIRFGFEDCLVVLIAAWLMYIVYRRNFKLKIPDCCFLAVLAIITAISYFD